MLTQTRSAWSTQHTCAGSPSHLDMGSYLYLGKGRASAKGGGRNLNQLLANMFEAVTWSRFLDAGYDAAYHYYLNRYRSLPRRPARRQLQGPAPAGRAGAIWGDAVL